MSDLVVSHTAPPHWQAVCVAQEHLFHSESWQTVLRRAFATKSLFIWDRRAGGGVAVTVFKAGPFRIGYVGFPVGGYVGGGDLSASFVEGLGRAALSVPVHLLRVPVSAFGQPLTLPLAAVTTPETAIIDLQAWNLATLPKLHRDIKKASRSGLLVIDADPVQHADLFDRLYRATVTRHGGSLRYNAAYFRALMELSQTSRQLRCLAAWKNGEIAAFLVVARDAATAYYLHGVMQPALKHLGGSDILLHEAIAWARREGARCFNLMSSPAQQTALIRYKEKWGAVTRTHHTYELPLHGMAARLFRSTARLYERIRRVRR